MNTLKSILLKLRFALLTVILLTAYGCGGGGSSTTPAAGSSSLSGTAATGAPIANATVHIKGANGVMVETTTDANGKYTSPNLATLTAPYLVHVIKAGSPIVELYSIGSAAGVVNIHPLTDMIIRTWYQVQGTDVVTAFNAATPPTPPTATELGVIKQVVKNLVAQFLGLIASVDSGSFDLISTPFTANSTGFDKFLDNIQVNAVSGVIGINTSGVSGAGTLAEYQATLAVSGTAMTSTLAEDLNNDATFSVVSTATNPISGIITSPYAGTWSLGHTRITSNGNCGTQQLGVALPEFLIEVDSNGNAFVPGKDLRISIATNGVITGTLYGDTLLGSGTCPAGTMTGTMTDVNTGSGTSSQDGGGTFTLTRVTTPITVSQFDGTYTGSWSVTRTGGSIEVGTLTLTVANGVIAANLVSTTRGGTASISGAVSTSGVITIGPPSTGPCFLTLAGQVSLTSSGAVISGTLVEPVVSTGSVATSCDGSSGTWTATRTTTTGVSLFDGIYTGSWSRLCPTCGTPPPDNQSNSGTFTVTVANGVFTNINISPPVPGAGGPRFDSGTVSSTGVITAIGATPSQCSSSVSTFTGQITITSSGGVGMAMTYSRPASSGGCAAESGTMTATRQ